jgi:two-component system chemotaxis sensor kinase CheA
MTGAAQRYFPGFHTVKGGAGFLNATELVTLCHLTENLFDRLRNGTGTDARVDGHHHGRHQGVREMFGELGQMVQPQPADPGVIAGLQSALSGEAPVAVVAIESPAQEAAPSTSAAVSGEPDWTALHAAVAGQPAPVAPAASELITKAEASAAGRP